MKWKLFVLLLLLLAFRYVNAQVNPVFTTADTIKINGNTQYCLPVAKLKQPQTVRLTRLQKWDVYC